MHGFAEKLIERTDRWCKRRWVGERWTGILGLVELQTIIHMMDKQQRPTVYFNILSISMINHNGNKYEKMNHFMLYMKLTLFDQLYFKE